MDPNPLTLREIPRRFESVLFRDRTKRAPEVAWTFSSEHEGRATRRAALVSHSADRLARAIALATESPADPRTLNAWGQSVGVSRGALRVWCNAAGVPARSCLDFLRVLRAVILSQNQTWDLLSILDVVDKRSLFQLLDRGGVRQLYREEAPGVADFLAAQRFIENEQVLEAVSRRLNASPPA